MQTVEKFDADVTVTRCGETVGGTSIMGLMMLAAGPGTSINVSATGPGRRSRDRGAGATRRKQVRRGGVSESSDLTLRSGAIRALLVITFLYPVVLCAIFFPTPALDLREHINLGLTFPLVTPTDPPLQTWIAGVIALTGARDAWLYVLVAQALNFTGIFYLALTAHRFIGPQAVLPLLLMATGSIFYSAATPSMALNADQIQVPIWAGFVFHALSALRDDRWRDWLAASLFASLGVFAKYYAAVYLGVFVLATLSLPAYRGVLSNPRFYATALLTVAIALTNIVPSWFYSDTFETGVARFSLGGSLAERAQHVWDFVRSFVLYPAPALVGLGVLAWRGTVSRPRMPIDPAQRLLVLTTLGIAGLYLVLIVAAGLQYSARYSYALSGMATLALLSSLDIAPRGLKEYARVLLIIWAAIIAGTLVYTQFVIHRVFRNPAPEAAALLRAAWDKQYACGPRYVIGDDPTARSVAIYFGRPALGVAFDEADKPFWVDRDKLKREGAIVVSTPGWVTGPQFEAFLKGQPLSTISAPYRRTWRSDRHDYQYYFIAPGGC